MVPCIIAVAPRTGKCQPVLAPSRNNSSSPRLTTATTAPRGRTSSTALKCATRTRYASEPVVLLAASTGSAGGSAAFCWYAGQRHLCVVQRRPKLFVPLPQLFLKLGQSARKSASRRDIPCTSAGQRLQALSYRVLLPLHRQRVDDAVGIGTDTAIAAFNGAPEMCVNSSHQNAVAGKSKKPALPRRTASSLTTASTLSAGWWPA